MNLYQKMLAITKDAQAIEKKGWNDYSKYKYIRAVDVIDEIQKLLVKHGVCLSISELDCERWNEQKEKGGFNRFCKIKCKATFSNVDDLKEFKEVDYYSISEDSLDKAIFKAKTNGLKYLLTQQFMLVTDVLIDSEEQKTEVQKKEIKTELQVLNDRKREQYSFKRYGVCSLCGGFMLLSKSAKGIYCENFRDESKGKHDLGKYTGQAAIPDEIKTSEEALKWLNNASAEAFKKDAISGIKEQFDIPF